MKIFIGADHRGWELKQELAEWLRTEGHEVTDMGAAELDQDDDYPDYGITVAEAVAENPRDYYGVLVCGSGVGMAVVANKVPGIRAALIHDPEIAAAAQRDDDINVVALGADYIDAARAKEVLQAWLATPFAGEARYQRRLDTITEYERRRLR